MSEPLTPEELEQRLLRDPFDLDLRSRYAACLLAREGSAEEAMRQAAMVVQQRPDHAPDQVLLAQARHACGLLAEALNAYARARQLPGFVPDDALDALWAGAQPAKVPHLQVVGGKAPAGSVSSIQAVPEDKLRFSSITGMDELKKTIRLKIIEPFLNPGLFARFRAQAGGGILLYGPPGCGKTMMARAVANECQASFHSIGVSDVLNMWLGESERNLAAVFEKARSESPSVLFFDELDALAYSRSKAGNASSRAVVNEFLSQLDGLGKDNRNVLVLAATNMPWDVDPAMKRPGRLARQIFVPPPDAPARLAMLQARLVGVPTEGVDLDRLVERTPHWSGADIDGLVEAAKEQMLGAVLMGAAERPLGPQDFEAALAEIQPSTLEWLRTVRNVVKYAGDDATYRDVERYLKANRMI